MGLDWNPLGKPQPGFENEYATLFNLLTGKSSDHSWRGKLKNIFQRVDREAANQRWFEIQISPYITLGAPQVGVDASADEWARSRYQEQNVVDKSVEEFLAELKGYYVADLAPPCDGVPFYSNGSAGYVEPYSFRAQFIVTDCKDIISPELLERCYTSCLAEGLSALGTQLHTAAVAYAQQWDLFHVESLRELDVQEGSPESNAHILFSAAKWCRYWSSRGHGLEAYF